MLPAEAKKLKTRGTHRLDIEPISFVDHSILWARKPCPGFWLKAIWTHLLHLADSLEVPTGRIYLWLTADRAGSLYRFGWKRCEKGAQLRSSG